MKTLIILIISLMPALLYAENTNSLAIHGKVVDAKNQPICFANVILMDADSTFIAGCTTDDHGIFQLQNAVSDAALLKISAIGYKTKISPLMPDGNMGVLVMTTENILLNEVAVIGQRPVHQIEELLQL